MSEPPPTPIPRSSAASTLVGLLLAAAITSTGVGLQMRRAPSVFFQGKVYFPDTDDFMRLVRVRKILSGQSVIVRQIPEINAPAGATLHWTAPMDYVLIAAAKTVSLFSSGSDGLECAAVWTPVILGGVYLSLVIGLMRRSLGWGPALFGAALVALSRGYNRTFELGHADHHCLIELFQWLALAGLWPNRRAEVTEPSRASAIVSGIAMGIALWVASQAMLVWAALFMGLTFATFHASIQRRPIWIARRRAWCLAVLSVLVIGWLVEQWPSPLRPELDKISLFHVLVALLVCFVPVGKTVDRQSPAPRLAVFGIAAALFAAWFIAHRAAMGGVFARPEFYYWSAVITELQPLYLHAGNEWSIAPVIYTLGLLPFALPLVLPVFALTKVLHCAAKVTLAVLAPALAVLGILHYRWIDHFNLAVMPVTVIVLFEIARRLVQQGAAMSAGMQAVARLSIVAAALAALSFPMAQRVLAPPPDAPSQYMLRAALAAEVINRNESQSGIAPTRGAILAEQEAGPTLLYMTGLPVVAGPYHRALDGQLESARFYAERDVSTARRQLKRLGIKYVLAPGEPLFQLRIMERIAFGEPKSYAPSQYKIEDGELMEGVSPLPGIEQTMAMRLSEIRDLGGLGVVSIAKAKETGPQIGERLAGFVYVVQPAPPSTAPASR